MTRASVSESVCDDDLLPVEEHGYLRSTGARDFDLSLQVGHLDVEDLLLVSDVVVPNYSSVVFDALAVDREVQLIAQDAIDFLHSRGVNSELTHDSGATEDEPFVEVARVRRETALLALLVGDDFDTAAAA